MQIKKKTHYTMKVLIHLSLLHKQGNKLVDIKQIADDLDISYEHTRKIIQDLAKLDVITSTRGRNGGVSLSKPENEISLFDLILAIEEVTMDDFNHDCHNCIMPADCKFRHMLKEQYKAFYMSFKDLYLSDILK